jgi:hypothetical protein
MSQLQFQQITFSNEDAAGKAGNNLLLDKGGKNDYNIFRYPLDIGAYDKGHYVVIHINEQRKTEFPNASASGDSRNRENRQTTGNTIAGLITSASGALDRFKKINEYNIAQENLRNAPSDTTAKSEAERTQRALNDAGISAAEAGSLSSFSAAQGLIDGVTQDTALSEVVKAVLDSATSNEFRTDFARTVRRTKDTIVMYMPDTLAFTNAQGYNEYNVGTDARLLNAIGAASTAMQESTQGVGVLKDSPLTRLGKNLTPFILSYFSEKNDLARVAFAATQQMVLNPMIELVYSTPQLRTFRFDFMFYPKSQKEAVEVNKILDCLRFHQAPEIATNGLGGLGAGAFLVPPSEFDIEFYYNGTKNPNMDRITTCVLESIDIDYAPNGFSAYEVENMPIPQSGGTGMPVAIRLSLQFKEAEYKTKSSYANYTETRKEVANSQVRIESPYDAFQQAQAAGLQIGQSLSGNYSDDLPTLKRNFEVGG